VERYLHDLRPPRSDARDTIPGLSGPFDRLFADAALNPELLGSENWLGSVLPIGDGVGFAARL
jgi:hypothetical protein